MKHGIDAVSAVGAIASVAHALPTALALLASTMSIVWYMIRIYEWWKKKQDKNGNEPSNDDESRHST